MRIFLPTSMPGMGGVTTFGMNSVAGFDYVAEGYVAAAFRPPQDYGGLKPAVTSFTPGVFWSNGSGAGDERRATSAERRATSNERRTRSQESGMQNLEYASKTPLLKMSDIEWPNPPSIDSPADVSYFIGRIVSILEPFIVRIGAVEALAYLDDNAQNNANFEISNAKAGEIRKEIIQRYGEVLRDMRARALNGQQYKEIVSRYREYFLEEIDIILDSSSFRQYEQLAELSRVAEGKYKTANGGIPFPERFAGIEDRTQREAEYRRLVEPFARAYQEHILAIRRKQNELLAGAGVLQNVHDYFFEMRHGATWSDAAEIARNYLRNTKAQNDEFIQNVAEVLGSRTLVRQASSILPADVRPWDVERAVRLMIEQESGTSDTFTMTLAEAVDIIKKFSFEQFGIDLDDPSYGAIIELAKSEKHKPVKGVSFSGVRGAKAIMAALDPEKITLNEFRTVLHETGHLIHNILTERYLKARRASSLLASWHVRTLSEAFAKSVESLLCDQAWVSKYLPKKFPKKYLEIYGKTTPVYEVFRTRRNAMLAFASHIISDPSYKTFDEVRQGIADVQKEFLGINGDADFVFGIPHLVNHEFFTYFMTYLFADELALQISAYAKQRSLSELAAYVPLLQLGGALTDAKLDEILLGGTLDEILNPEGAREAFNRANSGGEDVSDLAGSMPVLLRSGKSSEFFSHIGGYLRNQAAILKATSGEGVITGPYDLAEFDFALNRMRAFVKAVEQNLWFKDRLGAAGVGNVYKDVKKGLERFSNLSKISHNGVEKTVADINSQLKERLASFKVICNTSYVFFKNRERGNEGRVKVSLEEYERYLAPVVAEANRLNQYIDDAFPMARLAFEIDADSGGRLRGELHDAKNIASGIVGYGSLWRIDINDGKAISLIALKDNTLQIKELLQYIQRITEPLSVRYGVGVLFLKDIPTEIEKMELTEEQAEKVRRILENLVSNGIKYHNPNISVNGGLPPLLLGGLRRKAASTPSGVGLSFSPLSIPSDVGLSFSPPSVRYVRVEVKLQNGRLEFVVEDNGRGMSAEDLRRWGYDNWRAKDVVAENIPGTGTGSMSVRQLAHELGGTLEMSSEKNKGTKISFTIPVKPPEAGGGSVTLSMLGFQDVFKTLRHGAAFVYGKLWRFPSLKKGGKGGFEVVATGFSPPEDGGDLKVAATLSEASPDMLIEEVSKALMVACEIISKKPYKVAWDETETLEIDSLAGGLSLYFEGASGAELQQRMGKLFGAFRAVIASSAPAGAERGNPLQKFVSSMQAILSESDLNLWIHFADNKVGIVVEPPDVARMKEEYTNVPPSRRQTMSGIAGHASEIPPDTFVEGGNVAAAFRPPEVDGGLPPLHTACARGASASGGGGQALLLGGLRRKAAATPPPDDEPGFDGADEEGTPAIEFTALSADTVVTRLIHPATERDLAMADTGVFSPHGSPAGGEKAPSASDIAVNVGILKALVYDPTEFRKTLEALFLENPVLYLKVVNNLLKWNELSDLHKRIITEVSIKGMNR